MLLPMVFLLVPLVLMGGITVPRATTRGQFQVAKPHPNFASNLKNFLGWERTINPYSGSSAVPAPSSVSVDTDIPLSMMFASGSPVLSAVVTAGSLNPSTSAQGTSLGPMSSNDIAVSSGTSLPDSDTNFTGSVLMTSTDMSASSSLNSGYTPQYRGINVINHSPFRAEQWKNATEWNIAFQHIRNLPNNLNAVRLYSTTDGNARHLHEALPKARAHNISIHAGIWSGGDDHVDRFEAEKAALNEALAEFGCDNIIAVSVGNEDIYSSHRNDTAPSPLKDIMLLVNQVQEIMEVLDSHNCCDVKVTHADTFGDWLNNSFTEPLIRQVDFLTVNIFPFWSATPIDEAAATFWANFNETKTMADTYGKQVWVGETGWPREGQPMKQATPSFDNMRKYWDQVGCTLMRTANTFWYTEWDTASNGHSFGLLFPNGTSIIGDLSC